MRIVNRPPKLQWILRLFFRGYDFNKVAAFSFGDTIYTKQNPLPDYNLVHEQTHLEQMRHSKVYAILHFIRFVLSRKFRYKTELEAYQREYGYIKKIAPDAASRAAHEFAKVLAGEGKNAFVYGKVIDYDIALFSILNYSET